MSTAQLTKTVELPTVPVQPAGYWFPIYKRRLYHVTVNLGIEVKGFAESVAGLEALSQSAPETPVALMSIEQKEGLLVVFYDVANDREIGHYRLPKLAPTSD